ncbi:MAG: GNAT family N-acetyltransferase [Candidatus Cybelea sp.]
MAVTVRRSRSEVDFRQLHELFVAYEADLPAELRHGIVPGVDAIGRAYASSNAAFVATYEGRAIGCVALRTAPENPQPTAVLSRLFVRPRSRRLGAARLLVVAAIEFAREMGFERIVLDTEKAQLEPAYRLYQSLGFEECRPYAEVSYDSPTFMQLRL